MVDKIISAQQSEKIAPRNDDEVGKTGSFSLALWLPVAMAVSSLALLAYQTGPWMNLSFDPELSTSLSDQHKTSRQVKELISELKVIRKDNKDLRYKLASLESYQDQAQKELKAQEQRLAEMITEGENLTQTTLAAVQALTTETQPDQMATGSITASATNNADQESQIPEKVARQIQLDINPDSPLSEGQAATDTSTQQTVQNNDAEISLRPLKSEDIQTIEPVKTVALDGIIMSDIPLPNFKPEQVLASLERQKQRQELTTASIGTSQQETSNTTQPAQASSEQAVDDNINNDVNVISQTLFGLELGASDSVSGLHTQWQRLQKSAGDLTRDLKPHAQISSIAQGQSALKLLAGPFQNYGEALARCEELSSIGLNCRAVKMSGTPISM